MKKSTKYLIMSGMAFISGISAFAQTPKSCELGATLISPTEGAVFNYGETVSIKFDIKNNGPAAIVPTDTIYYQLVGNTNVLSVFGKNIANGASVTIDVGTTTNQNETSADETGNICIRLLAQSNITKVSGNDTFPAAVTYKDTFATNDTSCNTITLKKKVVVGIFDLERNSTVEALNLYPNPANNDVMFDITFDKAETVTTVVRDMVGRTVMQKDFGKVQPGNAAPFKLDISKLNAGIYFVEVMAGDRQIIGKVTKQK